MYTPPLPESTECQVLFSNRAACKVKRAQATLSAGNTGNTGGAGGAGNTARVEAKGVFDSALGDSAQCVALKPGWAKGHWRHGGVLVHLGRYQEAVKAARKGLKIKSVVAGASKADRTVRAALDKTLLEAQRGVQLQAAVLNPVVDPLVEEGAAAGNTGAMRLPAIVAGLVKDCLGVVEGQKVVMVEGGEEVTVPGWMPTEIDDTHKSRIAAQRLYGLLRDR